jgi:hypothetical protein
MGDVRERGNVEARATPILSFSRKGAKGPWDQRPGIDAGWLRSRQADFLGKAQPIASRASSSFCNGRFRVPPRTAWFGWEQAAGPDGADGRVGQAVQADVHGILLEVVPRHLVRHHVALFDRIAAHLLAHLAAVLDPAGVGLL